MPGLETNGIKSSRSNLAPRGKGAGAAPAGPGTLPARPLASRVRGARQPAPCARAAAVTPGQPRPRGCGSGGKPPPGPRWRTGPRLVSGGAAPCASDPRTLHVVPASRPPPATGSLFDTLGPSSQRSGGLATRTGGVPGSGCTPEAQPPFRLGLLLSRRQVRPTAPIFLGPLPLAALREHKARLGSRRVLSGLDPLQAGLSGL